MRERLLATERLSSVEWVDGELHLLDQRVFPLEKKWLTCISCADVAQAIRDMVVRGAPAIGISAGYGVVLAVRESIASGGDWQHHLEAEFEALLHARPTGANLSWVLERMRERISRLKPDEDPLNALETEAISIHESDREANLTMAQLGVELIRKRQSGAQNLMTHGNSGALATGGFGTGLGVISAAYLEGLIKTVYVGETRPFLQGSRLSAWELQQEGVNISLFADAAAAHLMKHAGITWIVVGADRITANGDVVSKIGTYQLAVIAMHHGVRFMVVAASSTIDMNTDNADDLWLEERAASELLEIHGRPVTTQVPAFNQVFDVTPADLIDAIVTEKGVVERPDTVKMATLMSRKRLH
jgi:methylthioribose-1-phosphate isomerase